MSRRLSEDEAKLWQALTASLAPRSAGRLTVDDQTAWQAATAGLRPTPVRQGQPPARPAPSQPQPLPPATRLVRRPEPGPPGLIEPGRKRRLVRGRDPIEAIVDLHGMDQDRARAALEAFLRWAHAHGHRAVLVITGKGFLGDGVLRQRAPEWLAAPALRPLIAGVSRADRRHGGEGALYVALKRRS